MHSPRANSLRRGFTVVEITLTIALLVSLAMLTLSAVNPLGSWRAGKEAGVLLQAVYAAQKTYLADNPNADITQVSAAQLIPYLSTGASQMPTSTALNGSALTVNFNVMPPVWLNGSQVYDPSGSSTDGLWDVGG